MIGREKKYYYDPRNEHGENVVRSSSSNRSEHKKYKKEFFSLYGEMLLS
jgi:hypothetical protein